MRTTWNFLLTANPGERQTIASWKMPNKTIFSCKYSLNVKVTYSRKYCLNVCAGEDQRSSPLTNHSSVTSFFIEGGELIYYVIDSITHN